MASRKIFNYQSIILKEMTIEKEGYDPDKLGISSGKFIWAVCRFCGQPSRIRKGFFIKAGSACHKECRLQEQKVSSPFADPKTREKAKKTCLKKFGTEHASQNKEIAQKISQTKSTDEYKARVAQTCLDRFGTENPFQSEEIKQKGRETNLRVRGTEYATQSQEIKDKTKATILLKHGVENVMHVEEIKDKQKSTMMDRYGTEHPMQNEAIKARAMEGHKKAVEIDENERYSLINVLRQQEFWDEMAKEGTDLKSLCEKFGVNYRSATHRLLQEEFKDRYYDTYSFPRQQQQSEIVDFIRSLGFQVSRNDRSVITPLELDIYVPDKKFAVEFNGSYWHSEAVLDPSEAKRKHRDKTDMCAAKGIRLFHIFELNWQNRKEQIKNALRTILGKNDVKIGARKCILTNRECPKFIDDNHIQGSDGRASMYFSLEHNGEIIASMTASKHHRQNKYDNVIMLSRLCFKGGVSISGGASKLFEAMKVWAKEQGYEKIISFSDSSWTEGGIYNVLGFEMAEELPTDYFYWDMITRKYLSKQSQQKSASECPEGMTEKDWAYKRGLYRIWDCGKKRWEYKL